MSFTVVETSLNRAEFRWKWLQFLRHTFLLGSILCLLVLLVGVAMLRGWVTNTGLATTFLGLLGVVGFIAWAIIIISVMAGAPDRGWLAASVERVDRRLLDRLNTLLFLERRAGAARTQSFALRIARQTQGVLGGKASPSAFPATGTINRMLAFLGVLALTIALYRIYSPWTRLLAAQERQGRRNCSTQRSLWT